MSLAILSQIPDDTNYDLLFANVLRYGCSWVRCMNHTSVSYWESMEKLLIKELALLINESWVKKIQEIFATAFNVKNLPIVASFLKIHNASSEVI